MTVTNMIDSFDTASYFSTTNNFTSAASERMIQCFDEQNNRSFDSSSPPQQQQQLQQHHPKTLSKASSKQTTNEDKSSTARKRRGSKSSQRCTANGKQVSCANCHAEKTPLWRKGADGSTLCNKCGLYWSRHGKHRPVKLDRSTPTKRATNKRSASEMENEDSSEASSPVTTTTTTTTPQKRKKSASLLTKRTHSPVTPTKSSKRVKRSLDNDLEEDQSPRSDITQDSDDSSSNSFFFSTSLSSSDEDEHFLQMSDLCGDERNLLSGTEQLLTPFSWQDCTNYLQRMFTQATQQTHHQQQQQNDHHDEHHHHGFCAQNVGTPTTAVAASVNQLESLVTNTNHHIHAQENDVFLSLFDNSGTEFFPTLESGTVDDHVVDMHIASNDLIHPQDNAITNDKDGTFLSF